MEPLPPPPPSTLRSPFPHPLLQNIPPSHPQSPGPQRYEKIHFTISRGWSGGGGARLPGDISAEVMFHRVCEPGVCPVIDRWCIPEKKNSKLCAILKEKLSTTSFRSPSKHRGLHGPKARYQSLKNPKRTGEKKRKERFRI